MKTLKQLKALAASLGCEIEDDRDNVTLYVHALNDMGWDGGSLTSLVHPYGSWGSATAQWRKEAINEAYERLLEYGQPDCPICEDWQESEVIGEQAQVDSLPARV